MTELVGMSGSLQGLYFILCKKSVLRWCFGFPGTSPSRVRISLEGPYRKPQLLKGMVERQVPATWKARSVSHQASALHELLG